MDKLTFYIPTLNAEKTIEQCIISLHDQTIKPNKIFVVDGGSKDKTVSIVKKFNIKVIKQKKKGLAAARNLAIKNCKTDFLGSVDADCVLERDWVETVMKNFKNKKIAGVGGRLIEKNTKKLVDRWRKFHLKQEWGQEKIKNPNFLFGSNNIFRVSALKNIDGYDEKHVLYYEDVDISQKLKKKGYELIYEPDAVAYHLRKDNLKTILRTTRGWSFFSYPQPDNFFKLILRLLIFNPYIFLVFLLKEILKFRFLLITINIAQFFYNQAYDIIYFKNGGF